MQMYVHTAQAHLHLRNLWMSTTPEEHAKHELHWPGHHTNTSVQLGTPWALASHGSHWPHLQIYVSFSPTWAFWSVNSVVPSVENKPLSHARNSRHIPSSLIRACLDPLGHLSSMDVFLYSSTLIPVIRWSITFQSSIRDHSLCPPSSSTSALGGHRTTDSSSVLQEYPCPSRTSGTAQHPFSSVCCWFSRGLYLLPLSPTPTLPSVVSPNRFLLCLDNCWNLTREHPNLSYCFRSNYFLQSYALFPSAHSLVTSFSCVLCVLLSIPF